MNATELKFHRAMIRVYERARDECGYHATRFIQMVSEQGGVEAARRLLHSDSPSDGFTTLWLEGRLDLTVEAQVIRPEFRQLFTDDERERALKRLKKRGWRESVEF